MEKKYLARIIANDSEGLQIISACCTRAKVKVDDIKYLKSNKIFLLLIERTNVESENNGKKINSVCKFEFVDKVKSKNIDQRNQNLVLELRNKIIELENSSQKVTTKTTRSKKTADSVVDYNN